LWAILQIKDTKPEFQHFEEVGLQFFGQPGWGLDVELAQYGSLTSGRSVASGEFDSELPFLKYSGWTSVGPGGGHPSIFVGDNGQGDVRAAQLMLAHPHTEDELPLLGAFIHHVQPRPLSSQLLNTSWASGNDGRRAVLATQGIHLFYNYAHAACLAFQNGFISSTGYRRVLEAVINECGGADQLQATSRVACQALRPEVPDGIPREAESCQKATEAAGPGQLTGYDVFPSGSRWMLGFCDELSSPLLERFAASRDTSKESDATRGYVYWALRQGVHCLTDCGQACDEVSVVSTLQPPVKFVDTGEKYHSGICNLQRNRICKVELI
jgi:hypothetical protein